MRLRPGPCDSLEVEQAGGRTDKRGQLMLAVDDCRHNPDDLFASAQATEQAGEVAEAQRLYRILMKADPTDASAAFNLGNMLRARGRNVEGEAALQAATGIDPAFAEAWYNACGLLAECPSQSARTTASVSRISVSSPLLGGYDEPEILLSSTRCLSHSAKIASDRNCNIDAAAAGKPHCI